MIATLDLIEIFDRAIDKEGSDYFDPNQTLGFLRDAVQLVFKQFLDPDGIAGKEPGKNAYWESSEKVSGYLQPFLRTVSGQSSPTGVVTIGDINTATAREVVSLTGWEAKTENGAFQPVIWKPHGAAAKQRRMPFFKPSDCNIWMSYVNDAYQFEPKEQINYQGQVIVRPLIISLVQDCEFPDVLDRYIAYTAGALAANSIGNMELRSGLMQQVQQLGI